MVSYSAIEEKAKDQAMIALHKGDAKLAQEYILAAKLTGAKVNIDSWNPITGSVAYTYSGKITSVE